MGRVAYMIKNEREECRFGFFPVLALPPHLQCESSQDGEDARRRRVPTGRYFGHDAFHLFDGGVFQRHVGGVLRREAIGLRRQAAAKVVEEWQLQARILCGSNSKEL